MFAIKTIISVQMRLISQFHNSIERCY